MAKIKKGILGPLSGTLGPVTGGTWKGIPYLRLATVEKKVKKRTPAQIASSGKLTFVNNLLVPFHAYINVGFANDAEQKTEISAAFSKNYHQAVVGVYPALVADYSKLILSVGSLPMVNNISMELQDQETFVLSWENHEVKNIAFDDQLMLIVYSRELNRTFGFTGGVNRSCKHCLVKIEEPFVGKELDVYLSMTSFNRKAIANSIYLGKIS